MRPLLAALLLLAGTAGAIPPPVPDPCLICAFSPPVPVLVEPGERFTLTGAVGMTDFEHAISCGDAGCIYNGATFFNVSGHFSAVPGQCGQYGGLSGEPTRPLSSGTPGSCTIDFDPPPGHGITSPGFYQLIQFERYVGGAVTGGISYLVGTDVELFSLRVGYVDPEGDVPFSMFAVRDGADPVAGDCISTNQLITTWLPTRTVPACVVMTAPIEDFVATLPNGTWDVMPLRTQSPTGKLRATATPWTVKRVVIEDADVTTSVTRTYSPELSVTAEVLGGDNLISVDEEELIRVTVTASTEGVGPVNAITFFQGAPLRILPLANAGDIDLLEPIPVPDAAGFAIQPGETRVFDVPVRGIAVGTVQLQSAVNGTTPYQESRFDSVQVAVQVTSDPIPPPPTSVCGLDVFTVLSATSAGDTLQLESTAGIVPGDGLVVDPCTADAEQVTAGVVTAQAVAVSPTMQKAHVKGTPVIKLDANRTILNSTAAAGATSLDVLHSDFVSIGDTVIVEAGTPRAEQATVTGFGSILIDRPLATEHAAGSIIERRAPTGGGGGGGGGCTTAPTLASVRCRLAAMAGTVTGLQIGKPGKPLLARLRAATTQTDRAAALLGQGKDGPAKAAVRKVLKAVKGFGKKLGAKKTAAAIAEAVRSELTASATQLRADLETLKTSPTRS